MGSVVPSGAGKLVEAETRRREDARSSPSRPLLIDSLSAHKQQITATRTPFLAPK